MRRRTGVSQGSYLMMSGMDGTNQASVTNLDESTIQTSIEMNSSTNKSSDDNETTS
jgi:hypothetical protein